MSSEQRTSEKLNIALICSIFHSEFFVSCFERTESFSSLSAAHSRTKQTNCSNCFNTKTSTDSCKRLSSKFFSSIFMGTQFFYVFIVKQRSPARYKMCFCNLEFPQRGNCSCQLLPCTPGKWKDSSIGTDSKKSQSLKKKNQKTVQKYAQSLFNWTTHF